MPQNHPNDFILSRVNNRLWRFAKHISTPFICECAVKITNYLYGTGVGGKTSGKNSSVGAGGRAMVKPSSFLYVKYET